ncbi:uncharacterized protein LOC129583070 isoform X4 [Paramacrobiotus metropolitanus]|uniref:uncharacterized protein LOC129583070 isoform X4 n=1 Tax=Paramacrobiotus metropolitanus TaxID=2943436 RepID=UPI002446030F|nr:uncharacterized protein LOC129583070 isoform X4 [Paramacrobiotus metropolitanus]
MAWLGKIIKRIGSNASTATTTDTTRDGLIHYREPTATTTDTTRSGGAAEPVNDEGAAEIIGWSMQYRYSHADYIGKGTFGTVYKAKVTQPGSYTGEDVVAVKVIQTAAADGQQSWKDALARLRRLTQLSNKYLVAYHKISIFTAPGGATVELAMDYLKVIQPALNTLNPSTRRAG